MQEETGQGAQAEWGPRPAAQARPTAPATLPGFRLVLSKWSIGRSCFFPSWELFGTFLGVSSHMEAWTRGAEPRELSVQRQVLLLGPPSSALETVGHREGGRWSLSVGTGEELAHGHVQCHHPVWVTVSGQAGGARLSILTFVCRAVQ